VSSLALTGAAFVVTAVVGAVVGTVVGTVVGAVVGETARAMPALARPLALD